jgi:hypothetical protein
MASANHIIDALGGTSAVASALKLTPSTVHSWRSANFIPEWRQASLLALAVELNKDVSATDFPHPTERVSKARAA